MTQNFERQVVVADHHGQRFRENPLKRFLALIKKTSADPYKNFCFMEEKLEYMPEMDIKKYLSLYSTWRPNSNDLFVQKCDQFISEIINDYTHLNELNKRQKKIIELYKCVSSSSQFIIWDNPQEDLDQKDIENLKEIISIMLEKQEKSVYISSSDINQWVDIATHYCVKEDGSDFLVENKMTTFNKPKNTDQNFLKAS